MPIINVELTQAVQDARSKKLPKVKNIWKQSGYDTVIKRFRDSSDLKFIERMLLALRNLDAQIIKELVELDGEVTGESVRDCVLENLVCWDEHLGVLARMLKASTKLAWEEFDKLDNLNVEME